MHKKSDTYHIYRAMTIAPMHNSDCHASVKVITTHFHAYIIATTAAYVHKIMTTAQMILIIAYTQNRPPLIHTATTTYMHIQ